MTHYVNYRAVSSGSHSTITGGHVRYSRTESYSYDSGHREYPRYYWNSLPADAPVEVRTWGYRLNTTWHDIPNPIQRGNHHRHGYNDSPVGVPQAPPGEDIRGQLPR
jgi:hypothetical protein